MSETLVPEDARRALEAWRSEGLVIVFTNGVFDLLHPGHVEYLEEAHALGDRLVVGINGDASVRRQKGEGRPIVPEEERAELLRALESVNLVVAFDDDTPERLIREVRPNVLVKGGDWALDAIIGREFVESTGGRVERIRVRKGLSSSNLVERILAGKSALDV
jgi:D-beta-D-heptose 7-phosphate kinase/D-beta-D-heptose 1-phosphate adenosyltransferase